MRGVNPDRPFQSSTVYNYFVEPNGMGPGPYTFRVTDVHGNVIEDPRIAHAEAQEVAGKAQFPACSDAR